MSAAESNIKVVFIPFTHPVTLGTAFEDKWSGFCNGQTDPGIIIKVTTALAESPPTTFRMQFHVSVDRGC